MQVKKIISIQTMLCNIKNTPVFIVKKWIESVMFRPKIKGEIRFFNCFSLRKKLRQKKSVFFVMKAHKPSLLEVISSRK
jgi:hypothetical protein